MRLILILAVSALYISASFGSNLSPRLEREINSEQPGSFCQGCRSIISFMSRFNLTSRREQNKELFNNFCEQYYPVSTDFRHGPCPQSVEGLFWILDHIDPVTHCDNIGACGSSSSISSHQLDQQSPSLAGNVDNLDGAVCDICTDAIQQVKTQLEDPKLIDDIHRKVDAFCEYLTVIDADKQCRAALESYIDQALTFIKQVKPKDLCRSIQLCPVDAKSILSPSSSSPPAIVRKASTRKQQQQQQQQKEQQLQKVLPTLADFNDFGIETSVHISGHQSKSMEETPMNVGIKSPNCLFCKTFVKEMFKFLKENRTEENIRDALDRGCDLIYHDGEKRSHCEDLVKAYTKELLELLADETNPEVICMLLEQCTYQTMLSSTKTTKTNTNTMTTNKPAVIKTGAAQLFDTILDRILEVVRSNHPSIAVADANVDKPMSMGEFISMLDPTIQLNSMRSCVECKLFFKYLQETFQEPTSQEEIKNWLLNNLCSSLGDDTLARSCKKFINQESAVFFKAIVESLNPKQSCEELKVCSSKVRIDYISQLQIAANNLGPVTLTPVTNVKRPASTTTSNGSLCDQCVQIVTKIDDYLSTHPIDHDISVLKDKVCNTIQDDNLRGECVMIIQTFGQEIIQAISNMDNPNQLCQKIALCSATR